MKEQVNRKKNISFERMGLCRSRFLLEDFWCHVDRYCFVNPPVLSWCLASFTYLHTRCVWHQRSTVVITSPWEERWIKNIFHLGHSLENVRSIIEKKNKTTRHWKIKKSMWSPFYIYNYGKHYTLIIKGMGKIFFNHS